MSLVAITRRSRYLVALGVLLLPAVAALALYAIADPERIELNDQARASAPGQFARLSDGYTHYEVGGPVDGWPVVLVAGFSVPYYVWDPTFAALVKARFRVLRYDYYGRGYSDRPDIPYDQDMYDRQLIELLAAVGMRGPVAAVGLSMGAAVVTTFADRHPYRVSSLVYVDPSFRNPYPAPTLFGWDFFAAVIGERRWATEQLQDFLHPERFPDWPDRYRVQMRYRGFRRARLSELVANAQFDQTDEILRVGSRPWPILVFWGREDRSVPFETSDLLVDMMPNAQLIPVEAAGHLPHLEQPEFVNPLLIEFLRR